MCECLQDLPPVAAFCAREEGTDTILRMHV